MAVLMAFSERRFEPANRERGSALQPDRAEQHSQLFIRALRSWTGPGISESPVLILTAEEVAELERFSSIMSFPTKGSRIFPEGGSGDFLYLLQEGVVMSYHGASGHGNGSDRQILAFHWPGDLFGLAEHNRYVFSAEAVTPCVVRLFPRDRLAQFLLLHPQLQEAFLVKAVHDLRTLQRQFIVMGRFDVTGRLAAFLLDCAAHAQYFDAARSSLSVPMSRLDIADYLGTVSETVTRAFGRLEEVGAIKRSGPRRLILNLQKLGKEISAETA
jgi:CRP-like cAMP-binding protein